MAGNGVQQGSGPRLAGRPGVPSGQGQGGGPRAARVSSRLLTTMAVVTANADQGRDYIANFEPFATDCLKRWPSGKPIEPDALARAICNDWDVPSMPINVAKILIKRAKRRGEAIAGPDGVPYPNFEQLMTAPSVAEKSQEAIAWITALEDAVVAYAAEAHGLTWTRDDASRALERLTEDYGAELALARRGGLAEMPARATETVAVVYGFARRVFDSDPASFDALVTMVQGTILMNTIYFDDIGSLSNKFPSLTVYLDSPILLRALGLAPEPVRVAAEEMLGMLRGFGVPLRVFPHTIDEMSGILERVAQNLRRGKQRMLTQGGAGGRNREVIDALVKKGWTSGEIDAMQADLGNHLSAMGVEIEDTPPHVEKDHIDEGRFTEILDKEVAYPTKPPLEKDLKSPAAVDRLRGKGRPRELGRAGAIFVTDNASVARASALFFKEADRKAPVPHCMLDTALTAQLWVRSAHRRPDLPRKLLIASSYAALARARSCGRGGSSTSSGSASGGMSPTSRCRASSTTRKPRSSSSRSPTAMPARLTRRPSPRCCAASSGTSAGRRRSRRSRRTSGPRPPSASAS